ncbi:hypothetical protein BX666DRAFT_1997029 [Dichotomocladium elegans]|nr:hypothetical protein BX666DRAFT_1997029 [Dichotomocladium elegans]
MFDEDEEDQELLRHYEDLNFHGDLNQSSSGEELSSDVEDTIRSVVEYGSSNPKASKKFPGKAPASDEMKKEKAAAADSDPSDQEEDSDGEIEEASSSEDYFFDAKETAASDEDDNADSSDDEEICASSSDKDDKESFSESDNESSSSQTSSSEDDEGPRVTRVINLDLDRPHYMDEVEESEEERDLNDKLENLIQDQIERKQLAKRNFHVRRVRLCRNCHQPGHDAKKCPLCPDCGAPRHNDRCPGLKYCTYCKRRGHGYRECTYDKESKSCSLCGLSYHINLHCPSIVHSYKENELDQESGNTVHDSGAKPFCYNCGKASHYGDDCPVLPEYLKEVPTAFSKTNATRGSRFNMRKNLKASASAFATADRSHHKRWRDHSDNERNRSEQSESTKRTRKDRGKQSLDTFFERPSAQERHYQRNARQLQSYQQQRSSPSPRIPTAPSTMSIRHGNTQLQRGTGNNNWNNIPKPTRSGTVSFNQEQRMDFPRNNFPPTPSLPKPSSSGVIDIPRMSTSYTPPSVRQPRFRGGYSRG